MAKCTALPSLLILLLNVGTLLTSLACPYCPYPTPPSKPPKLPPKLPPKHHPKVPIVKPPSIPKPPVVKPPSVPKPPIVKPPFVPKPPIVKPPLPPIVVPKPPIVKPPYVPQPPIVKPPLPPIVVPKPPPTPPIPPPIVKPPTPTPTPPPTQKTCSIDTLKLGACVDVLSGIVHIGIGSSAKDTCCPVLQGLVDLDAAICLCTTIKAKLLNINIIVPIALQVLVDCGKTPPPGFQCPA